MPRWRRGGARSRRSGRCARRGVHDGGVVGVGTAGHPAVQAEEVAEPGCKSPRVFGDEEGDVVALAQGVGVTAGGGADPAAPRAPVEGRFTGLSVSVEAEDETAEALLGVTEGVAAPVDGGGGASGGGGAATHEGVARAGVGVALELVELRGVAAAVEVGRPTT